MNIFKEVPMENIFLESIKKKMKNPVEEESLRDWFSKSKTKDGKGGWVQVGGKHSGEPCARQPGQTSTPKCRPSWEAAKMSKKEKEYAFRKKQKEDPNQPQKSGASKPTYVKTYKEEVDVNEEKDACYHKVKARYKVWPSAYASGALVKCRKKGAKNWGTKSEEFDLQRVSEEVKARLNVKTPSPSEIAHKFKKTVADIKKAIDKGIETEKEHTTDPKTAKEIATDHIGERPDYYNMLKKFEKKKLKEALNDRRDIIDSLKQTGFEQKPGTRGGDHELWRHPSTGKTVAVPRHRTVSPGVANQIRKTIKQHLVNEAFETSEKQSKNPNDPSSRFEGTKSLKDVFTKDTPHSKARKLKNMIKEK